jgi:transforming growth factor-beta-induced protein
MRKIALTLVLLAALVVSAIPTFAQQGTVVDVVVASDSFSTLEAAVISAGLADTLAGPGPFTVFAPTDGAFQTLLTNLGVTAEELLANQSLLTTVLLYHVVPGEVTSSDIVAAGGLGAVTTVGGELLSVDLVDGKVNFNNGQAIVSIADVQVSNGVIHIIDNVLLPPSVTGTAVTTTVQTAATPTPNIVEAAASISDFSTLVAAVQAAGLVDTLSGPGPFTVFAPTNGAFQTLLNDLGVSAEELLANEALLTQVLLYHVVPGAVSSGDIVAAGGLGDVATAGGQTVNIQVIDGKVNFNNGAAIVILPDLQVSNGIIHVIDNVLLPPS